MMLLVLILIPLLGGAAAYAVSQRNTTAARWIALLAMLANLGLSVYIWIAHVAQVSLASIGHMWFLELTCRWVPSLGIQFHLGMDGLSLLLIVLTNFLGTLAVATSWTEIEERVGFFHFNLLWVLAGITGVFLAVDLFLFYFFWELMLVPMYFLIAIWGHENRVYASIKFFLFTQLSSLLMLLAIIALYVLYGRTHGGTFDFTEYLNVPLAAPVAMALMLGFFAAFAVKLPVVGVHTWLPDAHTEAPTAGSLVLAGLLLKTGAYGLIRFVVPIFPSAVEAFRPVALALAVAGIIYGAVVAYGQTDLKRLIAYTSVSHMGFVLLGVFVWNTLALQGAMMQIICHGLATGGLFIFVGALQERTHTRDMRDMGGLWSRVPRMGAATMVLALASLGLPGLGSFIGEFLVLLGTFQSHPIYAGVASLGLIASTVYSLRIVQAVFHGEERVEWKIRDFGLREMAIMGAIITALVWLGLYPQPVIRTVQPAFTVLQESTTAGSVSTPKGAQP